MSQRCFYFLVVCGLLFSGPLFGQQIAERDVLARQQRYSLSTRLSKPPAFYRVHLLTHQQLPLSTGTAGLRNIDLGKTLSPVTPPSVPVLQMGSYASRLGFFCKKELQLDRISPVPIRFRLGSSDYVNYLEQKPNAAWRR